MKGKLNSQHTQFFSIEQYQTRERLLSFRARICSFGVAHSRALHRTCKVRRSCCE